MVFHLSFRFELFDVGERVSGKAFSSFFLPL